MRVMVTGHDGYIGTVLTPMLQARGHEVVGFDSLLYADCALEQEPPRLGRRRDIRDVTPDDLEGVDAVIHLAAISNDPLGDLNPDTTTSINHAGTMRIAKAAKAAGVSRFAFSSSCSIYGAHGDAPLDERAEFLPVTPYGESKVLAERDLTAMADDDFSPTYLRNATAYGASPRIRGDLVVNNLVGYAVTTGEVMLKSDGLPWRPLVHVEDIARAFVAVVEAPRERVHLKAWNVANSSENYQIRQVAEIVEAHVPDCRITFAADAGPDLRNYRVNCDKIAAELPTFQPKWTVADGVAQVHEMYRRCQLTLSDLTGGRTQRIRRVRDLQEAGRLGPDLRWTDRQVAAAEVQPAERSA